MSDQDDAKVVYFPTGSDVVLEKGGGWQDGHDRIWKPSGWIGGDGRLRVPIQHRKEDGAACDVDMIIRDDGTTNIRGGRRAE